MNDFFLGVLTALVLIPSALLSYFVLGFAPVRSDVAPAAIETLVMGSALRASIHRRASGMPPAPPVKEQMLVAGGKLYGEGCAGCHGELGKPFQEDRAHYPPVPQLPLAGTQYSLPEVAWIIKHGIRFTPMSAYGRFYTEDQVWALAAFVEQIDRIPAKTLGSILSKTPGDASKN